MIFLMSKATENEENYKRESVAIVWTYISPLGRAPSTMTPTLAFSWVHGLLFGITFWCIYCSIRTIDRTFCVPAATTGRTFCPRWIEPPKLTIALTSTFAFHYLWCRFCHVTTIARIDSDRSSSWKWISITFFV